jgi:hypothetical protein
LRNHTICFGSGPSPFSQGRPTIANCGPRARTPLPLSAPLLHVAGTRPATASAPCQPPSPTPMPFSLRVTPPYRTPLPPPFFLCLGVQSCRAPPCFPSSASTSHAPSSAQITSSSPIFSFVRITHDRGRSFAPTFTEMAPPPTIPQ